MFLPPSTYHYHLPVNFGEHVISSWKTQPINSGRFIRIITDDNPTQINQLFRVIRYQMGGQKVIFDNHLSAPQVVKEAKLSYSMGKISCDFCNITRSNQTYFAEIIDEEYAFQVLQYEDNDDDIQVVYDKTHIRPLA